MSAYAPYEPISIGWPSLIPPIMAMALALITKQVVPSLFSGVFSAAIIYSLACSFGYNEDLKSVNVFDILFRIMEVKISDNAYICLFILFIGGLIRLVSVSGGAKAYAAWAKRAIKGRKKSMFCTAALGCFMFLDDYFNSMTTGTVMSPVTTVNNVSKSKTAYIVHTISTNMCITIPLTSWAAAIVSQIKDSGVENSFLVFLKAIPFNLYSLLSFAFIVATISLDFDYGKMKEHEENAKNGIIESQEGKAEKESANQNQPENSSMWDLLLPIIIMVILALYFMFSIGYKESGSNDITVILGATSAPKALLFSCFVALLFTILLYIPRKIMNFTQWIEYLIEGMRDMLDTLIILVLAWSISGLSGELLQTGNYIGDLVRQSAIPPQLIPTVVFIVGMVLSFATGTAWGTFSLLIPIAVSICKEENEKYLLPSIASCLCGAVFGNNTSPISDTTVLVSSAVKCPFLLHVNTQLPYASTVAVISIIGFMVAGFSEGNLPLTLGVSFVLEGIVLSVLYMTQKNRARQLPVTVNGSAPTNSDVVVTENENDYVQESQKKDKPLDNEDSGLEIDVTPIRVNGGAV